MTFMFSVPDFSSRHNPCTRTLEFQNGSDALLLAIAIIEKYREKIVDGKPPKKRHGRVKDVLLKIREIVDRNPRITQKELARLTGLSVSTIRSNKEIRAILYFLRGSFQSDAAKRYTDITYDSKK